MPKFTVNVTETSYGFVENDASCEEEAHTKAREVYYNGNVIWTSSDFTTQYDIETKNTGEG